MALVGELFCTAHVLDTVKISEILIALQNGDGENDQPLMNLRMST
jgi:hypothetical protein